MTSFLQVILRTHHVDAAREFYASVLPERTFEIVQLHEQAVQRGASPHWLGMLEVSDVAHALSQWVSHGATALGPVWRNPEGLDGATLRDPGGAVLGLAKPTADMRSAYAARAEQAGVVGYGLHTTNVEQAKSLYTALAGWEFRAPFEFEGYGWFHPFAFKPGAPSVGTLTDIAGRSGLHPHWLFQFRTPELAPALEAVNRLGGKVAGCFTLHDQSRLAVCDDGQGAAFALRELTQ
jgi:predicted enzyme related to lactoylglutathione lyase